MLHASINPRRGWGFIHSGPTGAYPVGTRVCFLGDKAARALSRPLVVSSAEVKNVCKYTHIPFSILMAPCLIKHGEKFTFAFCAGSWVLCGVILKF
jgi:hypothetical protein